MIAGATRGGGGPALARHLLSQKDGQQVLLMPSRGLAAEDLKGQIAEIVADAAHGRTDRPIHHLHVDPPSDASNPSEIIGVYLRNYEAEFGLRDHQRAGVFHFKNDRQHAHVVYSLVGSTGYVTDLRHEYARREKVSRITEHECDLPLIKGRHNRAVAQALRAEGRADIADAMEAGGLLAGRPSIAHSTPRQRAQAERTAVPIDAIRSEALAAWKASDDAPSFAIALHAFGSTVVTGESGLVLVDRAGGTHSLNRVLAAAARATGEDRITAAAVRRRLAGVHFQTVEEAKNARSSRRDTERSDRRAPSGPGAASPSGPAEGPGRGNRPTGRTEGAVTSDSGNSPTSSKSVAAHRKHARKRAAVLALSTIDLQSINQKKRDIMKEIKAQDFKAKILAEITPKGFNAHAFSLDLHMIKQPSVGNSTSRIMTRDGGWVEYDSRARTVRTWGRTGRAQVLAQAIASAIGCEVEHLAKTASVGADAAALKVTNVSEDAIKTLVVWWAMRGYSATTGPDGCWITAGRARILDTGNRMEIHGGLTDEAIAVTLTKARDAWGGGVYLDGECTQGEQDRMWIATMRAGIEIQNCNPSQSIQSLWAREQDATAKTAKTISAVRTEIVEAQRLVDAANGDIEQAKKLPGSLQAFVAIFLDDDQRRELAAQPIAEIVPHLERFRKLGTSELESYEAPTGPKIAFVLPENKTKRDSDNAHTAQ